MNAPAKPSIDFEDVRDPEAIAIGGGAGLWTLPSMSGLIVQRM
jgi:hypothetical protein